MFLLVMFGNMGLVMLLVVVVKCPVCGKNVEKSKFSLHQQSHSQQRRPVRSKAVTLQKMVDTQSPPQEKRELVELVELEDDNDEATQIETQLNCNTPDMDTRRVTRLLLYIHSENLLLKIPPSLLTPNVWIWLPDFIVLSARRAVEPYECHTGRI